MRFHRFTFQNSVGPVLYIWLLLVAPTVGDDRTPDFESDIAPLLIKRCVECHQGKNPAGGLSLTSQAGLISGGESGAALDERDPHQSYLLERVVAGEMPPEKQGRSQKLSDSEIEVLRGWLVKGAQWPADRELDYFERTNEVRAGRDWWSLQPIVRPPVPKLTSHEQPANPIDAFILSELESKGIHPAPKADRRTLIRRLYDDLLGLPPSEQEIQRFVEDPDPDAWSRLIDRLLARPQYGERWARFWLDLARYADTSGYERDQEKPFAWKYRDWVVKAFNDDMSYDQFIIEQIAGDEIPNRTEQSVIATGFLRLGTWNDEPNDQLDYQYERLEDLVHTTSSTFFALTVKCARCHSHKFDAIKQDDYYRMASAFWPGPLLTSGKQLGGPTDDQLGFSDVLGWTDLGASPEPLHVLKNGERHQPLDEIVPATLSMVPALEHRFEPPPAQSSTTHRRLQLAKWIANPKHPLTSRVLVNRLWQHHFGKAIVRTPNNFGFLADPPTHPELLDWLAAEFIAGGRHMKPIHKLILTSQTWQQQSIHPQQKELEQRDSSNRLWWRSERRRLDAESLRDSLLAVSGELDLTVGGPSFKASITPEALEGLSRKASAWEASPAESQHRRSLYMHLKRGLLPPLMTAFDQCDPTLSCGQRDVTILPTQALALLNGSFIHDRSQNLAETIVDRSENPEEQVRLAWRNILKRPPTAREVEQSLRHLEIQTATFSSSIDDDSVNVTEDIDQFLVLHLSAAQASVSDDQQVNFIRDLTGHNHHATQEDPTAQPTLIERHFGGNPVLHFNGQNQFMKLEGQILDGPECTIICVVNDKNGSGHREVISNWNRDGNSTSSLFLGLTADNTVRFSDAFGSAGEVSNREQPFILSATNSATDATVFQDGQLLKKAGAISNRRLNTPWVIGQQGNIDGEFWKGGIAEIRVYDRALSDDEREIVEGQLAKHYGITLSSSESQQIDARTLALASLCHVLMNSNEFLFVD